MQGSGCRVYEYEYDGLKVWMHENSEPLARYAAQIDIMFKKAMCSRKRRRSAPGQAPDSLQIVLQPANPLSGVVSIGSVHFADAKPVVALM